MWDAIARDISDATGVAFHPRSRTVVAGGCINAGYHLRDGDRGYFVKTNAAAAHVMFVAEAAALGEIAATDTVRVPTPIAAGHDAQAAWLVLEYIELHSLSTRSARALGEQLARMHRHTAAEFGWARDNAIGSTPQCNERVRDWVEFWRERRLRPQFALARERGYGGCLQKRGERLMTELVRLFDGYAPQSSLLHGDLWSGNAAADARGAPVVFDPAIYYGDREADLAMTELFGGFPREFYAAYQASWPLDSGYAARKPLYNLYHVLNHLNLFGGSYLKQAESMTARLLAQI